MAILRAKEKPKSRFAFTKPKYSPSPGGGQSRTSPTIPPPTSSQATSTMHTISSLTDTLVRPELAPGTGAYTLSLSHLYRCVIDLCPPHATDVAEPTLTTLHAKDLQQCIMIAPVLPGSAMLSEMVDCLVIVGAQQFRIHSSTNTQVLLNVASLPVIEHCTNLAFGPCPLFLLSTLPAVYESKHIHVQDFDWVRGGQSPNWRLLSKEQASALFTQEMASRLYNVREKDEDLVMEWTKRLRSG